MTPDELKSIIISDAAPYLDQHLSFTAARVLSEVQRTLTINLMAGFACQVLIKYLEGELKHD